MTLVRAFTSIAAAASVATAPVAAQAATAMRDARTGSPVEGEQLGGSFVIPLILLVAVVFGALIVISDDDEPASP